MKNVVITGATGFIGYSVLKELYSHGLNIIAVVRPGSVNFEKLNGYNIKIVECELDNILQLTKKLQEFNVDTIYHFAWQGVYGNDLKDDKIQLKNVEATLALLDVAKELKVKTFIGAGSIHEIEAIVEMKRDKIITNTGLMYKSAKIVAHYAGKAKAGNCGIRFFWPYITNTYGVGEVSNRLINTIIRNILSGKSLDVSDGEQWYDFVYIEDLAKAFYLIGERGVDGTNYTIGYGEPRKLKEFLKIVEKSSNDNSENSYIDLGYGKMSGEAVCLPLETFDISKLQQDTGYEPKITFEEGIRRTVEWIKNSLD